MELFIVLMLSFIKSEISVFENVKQPFKINNIRYRESINPIFALESSNKWATISTHNIANYQGKIIYGNNQVCLIYCRA